MENKKGNTAVIALIIVIVAITAGVIGYLFAKRAQAPVEKVTTTQPSVQTQQVQQPAQSVDETADWQTYQDNTLGIEFRFPTYFGDIRVNEIDALENMGVQKGKKIAIELDGKANISIAAYTDDFESFSPFEFAYQSDYNCPKPLSYGEGGDACKTVMMPAGDMVLRNVLREIEGGIYPKTAVLVNNKSDSEFTKIAFTISFDDFNKRVQSMYDAVDDKKRQKAFTEGTVYSKKIMGGGDLSRADNTDLAIFNKIVSTLKFTDAPADETVNWETFKSQKYGYEIKYPAGWGKLDEKTTPEKYLTLSNKEKGKRSAWVNITILENDNFKTVAQRKKDQLALDAKVNDQIIFGDNGAVSIENPSTQAPGNLVKYVVKNGIGYEFKILFVNDADITLGEKILTTFKFTN